MTDTTNDFTGTVVYILIDKEVAGYLPSLTKLGKFFEAIQILKEASIKNLLTGDNEKVAKKE